MDQEFWQQRWREGRIGFHQERVLPLLRKHWGALALPKGSRVFVPLAGKTLDMLWLAAQGHRVLGVELSALAVAQFFEENDLMPETFESPYGVHHCAGDIELILGDAFALDEAILAGCAGVYDRAALVALPADMRRRYADALYGRLPRGCRGLLVSFEYPQHERDGPPFSVDEAEVRALYAPRWRVERLERRDLLEDEPGFGTTALATTVYRLQRAD